MRVALAVDVGALHETLPAFEQAEPGVVVEHVYDLQAIGLRFVRLGGVVPSRRVVSLVRRAGGKNGQREARMEPTMQVVVGWLVFGGTHTALSHPPVRSRLVARLGERGFQLAYSLVALAIFVPLAWTFFARRVATPIPLPLLAQVPGVGWATMALMLVAVPLIVLGFARPNPVSALTGRAGAGATGALRITRHPGFMGVALAGMAHLLVNPAPIDRAFFGGLVVYCLVGCAHQDWRRRRAGGAALAPFFAETSFLPFVAILQGRNRLVLRELRSLPLAAALVLYALLFTVHHRILGG